MFIFSSLDGTYKHILILFFPVSSATSPLFYYTIPTLILYVQSHAHATKSQITPPQSKHSGLQVIVKIAANHSSS